MSDELKPCPFCGGKAEARKGMAVFQDCEIHCTVCSATSPCFDSYGDASGYESNLADATMFWNTRTPTKGITKEK